MIKKLALVLLAAGAFGAGVEAAPVLMPTSAPKFPVGPGATHGRVFGATVPGSTQTMARDVVCLRSDGLMQVGIILANATGTQLHHRDLVAPADHSKVIDAFSNVVLATPEPSSVVTPCGQCLTAIDSAISNAVAAGTLKP